MRRATLRRVGLVAAGLTLVLLVVVTLLRVAGARELRTAVARFSREVGPVDFEAYRPAAVPEDDNGALPVLEALERLDALAEVPSWGAEMGLLRVQNRRPAVEWNEADWKRARTLVGARGELFEILRRVVGRSGSSFELEYTAGPIMEVPGLLAALQAGDLLFARARLAYKDGELDRVVQSVETLGALGRVLEREPLLVFQLVGAAVEVQQHRAIQEVLAGGGLGPEALGRLRAGVEEWPRTEPFRLALGTEGTTTYAVAPGGPQRGWSTRGWSAVGPGALAWRWVDRIGYQLAGQRAVARGLEYYRRVALALSDLSFAEMLERPGLLEAPAVGDRTIVVDLERAVGRHQGTAALAGLCRQALDVAVAGAEGGSLPEAPPTGLEADAGPFIGNPSVYRRLQDGSATLTVPGADDLWWKLRSATTPDQPPAPLFTWHLAAPE